MTHPDDQRPYDVEPEGFEIEDGPVAPEPDDPEESA